MKSTNKTDTLRENVRPRSYRSTGVYALQAKLAKVEDGQDWTEALGPQVGEALRVWRGDLIEALGGEAVVSPQQRAIVELCARTYLMVESVDAYVLSMPSLVNKSKRSLFPVVIERRHLAEALARYLSLLGLERRTKPVPSLRELLAATPQAESEPGDDDDDDDEADAAALYDQEIERRARELEATEAAAVRAGTPGTDAPSIVVPSVRNDEEPGTPVRLSQITDSK
jgi:hypothetical protein